MPTRWGWPVWIGISLMYCVYIRLRPTNLAPGQPGFDVLLVTPVGRRSISGTAVVLVMNQSNSCPVQKSTTFITTPACCDSIVGAEYGAPPWMYVPWTTRPGRVPGVVPRMVDSNVTVPLFGTGNDAVDPPKYFRWSNTLKSCQTVNGAALTVSPFGPNVCVPPD